MPKLGMQPIRRKALIEATIDEIGAAGSLDITVNQIARRAGVSRALTHHYFGSKDKIFLEAMRHILGEFGAEVRAELAAATSPRDRIEGIIRASFSPQNFRAEIIAAWLNFYALARKSGSVGRLLRIYQRRLYTNLLHGLRSLAGSDAPEIARGISALIDGLYLRQALQDQEIDAAASMRLVTGYLDLSLARSDAQCLARIS